MGDHLNWVIELDDSCISSWSHFLTTQATNEKNYEGWKFNSGNYLFTNDTK